MHPALHRKNTPSLALNKYLKILVFYFYYFLNLIIYPICLITA